MKKKIISVVCLAAMLISFAGCNETVADGSTASSSAPEVSDTSAVTTVTSATTTTTTTATTTTAATTTTTAEAETTAETTTLFSNETPDIPQYDINDYRVIGDNGILVAGMDGHFRGIMFFGGTYGYCDRYIYDVKQFQAALPQTAVYSMVIPTSVDFYNPEEYRGHSALQKEKIDYIEAALKKAGITNISVYDVMASHVNEEIYSRTDHHWMPLGAYYAAEKFLNDIKLPISPLEKYRAETRGGYVGSMYYYSGDVNLYNDPEEYTVYYSPNEDDLTTMYYNRYMGDERDGDLFVCNDASYYYLSFLGSDDLIAHVKTNVKNGRNLVVIKESYGNALIPFFTEAFENIYVLDLRYCEVNAIDFCKQVDATDLLFANCAYTVAGGNCEYFEYIRTI